MRILGHISFWMYFISYTHCSLFNPGYPKNDLGRKFEYPSGDYYLYNLCNFYIKKSRYEYHCLDCDICIENCDHHCLWKEHYIGKKRILLFIFLFFVLSYYCLYLYCWLPWIIKKIINSYFFNDNLFILLFKYSIYY